MAVTVGRSIMVLYLVGVLVVASFESFLESIEDIINDVDFAVDELVFDVEEFVKHIDFGMHNVILQV